ncbi:metallophosphoesterase family protein [Nitrospira sp. NS4]|uniref:metallophosphoesterase family protein n=1 Tax=Nitrospira sp. NS4 TaxID=3414498 RepID=UPI003C2B5563
MHRHTTVEVIGSLADVAAYDSAAVEAVMQVDATRLAHGSEYTGRPATHIFAGERDVVKLRSEVRLDRTTGLQWIRQALDRERAIQVHHPLKTWFLFQETVDSPPLIGSICPKLTPLHTILRGEPADSGEALRWLRWLEQLFAMNFRVAKASGLALDEGLSNFGLDEVGTLYYLDDDTYSWDRFATTAQMIGTCVRSLNWLTVPFGGELGKYLRQGILTQFGDSDGALSLAEQLRDVFIPAPARREVLEAIQEGLVERRRGGPCLVDRAGGKPLAVLADIHGNLPALEAVLSYLTTVGVREGIVLGDVVGYGPHPRQCIERLRQTNFVMLKGNHDDAAVTGQIKSGMTQHARWSLEWTCAQLQEEDRKWLQALPPVLHGDRWIAVHGSPLDPSFFNAYVYHMTYEDNLNLLQRRGLPICFHGHTHMPGVYARQAKRGDRRCEEASQSLGEYDHCLICPGSVGQPRNGRTAAQFGIYDPEERQLVLHALNYDVAQTVSDMRAADFPGTLIARLNEGT